MSIPYAELAKKAKDEVADLEEPFRSIAYQTILQDLIQEGKRAGPIEPKRPASTRAAAGVEDPVGIFMTNVVDAGPYAKLFASKGKLVEKSLAVLKIARDQLGIDGLTAPQISEVLTKKFRVSKVHTSNVARDVAKATEYVHRIAAGEEYKYLLMAAGEQRLQEVVSQIG
ncbi:MAG TPA: hypothetical protein VFA17_08800 [Thermoplasmata archaeon]|jgi:hypothetical protein|nr:hypothetical protein [Thermoplasmata archaeon]